MIEIEQWGKMIIWLWNRYIKKKPIPYIDLEFHYPMWMFYLVGGILGGLILGIALFYFILCQFYQNETKGTSYQSQHIR